MTRIAGYSELFGARPERLDPRTASPTGRSLILAGTSDLARSSSGDASSPYACRLDGGGERSVLSADSDRPVILMGLGGFNEEQFERFGCDIRAEDPETRDRVEPDVRFRRQVHTGAKLEFEDGEEVRFWSFRDPDADGPDGDKPFPAPLIRLREGQVAHVELKSSKGTHTIHMHGLEPTPHNDGVGHTSFEVSGSYTYQLRPHEAGTYAYHCHKNTPLHFEMGMYGPCIVDPPEGPGVTYHGNGLIPYDHEVLWFPDDVDPRWHEMDHDEGVACGELTSGHGLHRFEAKYAVLSGVPSHLAAQDPRTTVTMGVGETLLARIGNASYQRIQVSVGLPCRVIAFDGHTLGRGAAGRYSSPFDVAANRPQTLTTAQRMDVLIRPTTRGTYPVRFDFHHWVSGAGVNRLETTITVE